MRVKLSVPFNNKNEVKEFSKWDNDNKLWVFIGTDHGKDRDIDIVKKYELVYLLETKFKDNSFIKANGGVYDENEKKWRTHISNKKLTDKFKFEISRYYEKNEEIEDEEWCFKYCNKICEEMEKKYNIPYDKEKRLELVNEQVKDRLKMR